MNENRNRHSAGGIVINAGKVLTIEWLTKDAIEFPKGTLEPGEASDVAALREVREETGYDTTIVATLPKIEYSFTLGDGKKYHKVVDFYLMELANSNDPQPQREPTETFENLWLSFDDALALLTFDDSRDLLKKVIALNKVG